MAFSIGRVGLNPTGLGNPTSLSINGDEVRLGGRYRDPSAQGITVARVLVDQLRGLENNPDEPIIPAVWDDEPSLTGFYRVGRVSIDLDPAFWSNGHFDWSVALTRITDSALPLVENTYALTGRANDHGVTLASSTPWIWRNVTTNGYYKGAAGTGVGAGLVDNDIARPMSALATKYIDTTLSTTAGVYTASYPMLPGQWYDRAATVEVSYNSGATFYPVVGRQFRSGYTDNDYLVPMLRVSNGSGLIRFGNLTYTSGAGRMVTAIAGVSETLIACTTSAGSHVTFGEGGSILRNAPHVASVRFSADADGHGTLDATLRRGSLYTECVWSAPTAACGGVVTGDNAGHTAITGGTKRTSQDANNTRIVVLTPKTKTNDLTSGGFTLSTQVSSLPFAVGFEGINYLIPATPASGGSANDLIYQYFAAVTENVRLVTR